MELVTATAVSIDDIQLVIAAASGLICDRCIGEIMNSLFRVFGAGPVGVLLTFVLLGLAWWS